MIDVLKFLRNKIFKDNVFIAPNIPAKKLKNALEYIAYDLKSSDEILCLVDDTLFGSNKCGIAISKEAVYFKSDFMKPFRVELRNIEYCDVQKSDSVGAKIFINDEELFTCSCAGFGNAKKVFQAIMDAINDSRSNVETIAKNDIDNNIDKSNKTEQQIGDKNSDLPQDLPQQECNANEPKNKSNESKKEQKTKNHSLLKIREPDNLITFLKNLKIVDAGFGAATVAADLFANFILKIDTGFSNKNSKQEITANVRGSIIKMTLAIRNNVERLNIIELQNDIATMEFVIFSSTLIYSEIVDRGYDRNIAFEAVRLGLLDIFKQDTRYFIGIIEAICSDIDSQEYIGICFVSRLYFTNFANETLPYDIFSQIDEREIGRDLISFARSYMDIDDAVDFNPYDNMWQSIAMFMTQQYAIFDIVSENILNEAYSCANKICK